MFDKKRFDSGKFDHVIYMPVIVTTATPPISAEILRTIDWYGGNRLVLKVDSVSKSPTIIMTDGNGVGIKLRDFEITATICDYTSYEILKELTVTKLVTKGTLEINLDTADLNSGYYMLHISMISTDAEYTAPSNGYIPVTIL